MADFIAQFGGIGLAFLGAALAVGLCCVGSARGTGMVGEAATGVLSETPEHFSKCLILQVLPGTQAVSYTHLDVYKRQCLGFKRTLEPLIMVPMGIGMMAVNCGMMFLTSGTRCV